MHGTMNLKFIESGVTKATTEQQIIAETFISAT